jgi:hypothetical protein
VGRWDLTLRAVVIGISHSVGILIVDYWAALGDRQITPGAADGEYHKSKPFERAERQSLDIAPWNGQNEAPMGLRLVVDSGINVDQRLKVMT